MVQAYKSIDFCSENHHRGNFGSTLLAFSEYYLLEEIVVEPGGVALPMLVYGLSSGEPANRLLRLAQTGDPAAFESVMRMHELLVARTALQLTGNRQDAQDAAQEVFLRLHRNLAKIDDSRNLPGWLYRVTVNACRDILRKRKNTDSLGDLEMPVPNFTEARLSREQQLKLVGDALRTLPEKERAAVSLRDIEGLSTREVAEILGSSEATVRSQISAARLKIRKILRRRL
jgi:RNA polymerase sigma-70 factor (ECF subfamily)